MSALDDVLPVLRCPVCSSPMAREARQVRCRAGHAADVARQGYLNLVGPRRVHPGDDAAMVEARAAFLGAGHYAPLVERLQTLIGPGEGMVVEPGGGTGHYLAGVMHRHDQRNGLCLEVSTPALRRAARAHPRVAAIGADAWARWPLADGCADVVLSVFGPRNAAETERVLSSRGRVVIVVPRTDHLAELTAPLGLIGIAADKLPRIAGDHPRLRMSTPDPMGFSLRLHRPDVANIVAMSPSARHLSGPDLAERIARLPATVTATVALDICVLQRSASGIDVPEQIDPDDRAARLAVGGEPTTGADR